jgi:trigger factor
MADATTTTGIKREKAGKSVVSVTVPAEAAAAAEKMALERLGSRVNVKGFRPGHAPEDVVRSKVDPEQLFEETVRLALRSVLPTILKEHNLAPIVPPRIEAMSREPLLLHITFIERPPVKIKKPESLVPKKEEVKAKPEDIERVVQSALAEHRTFAGVERPAKKGDRVTAAFTAVDEKGADIAGLRAEAERIVIGESRLLPGFEDQLVGIAPGGEKTFTLTLPEKFQAEHLRNKPATFTVKIQSVEEVTTPAFDDEFAKKHMDQPSAQAFKDMVASSIKEQEEQFQRMARERQLLDAIRDAAEADLPDELVDQELRQLVEEWAMRLEQQGKTVEDALKAQGKNAKEMETELRAEAANRWKLRLGIAQLIDDKKIEVSPDEEMASISDFLDNLTDEERPEAEARIKAKDSLYDEVSWRAKVDKLIASMLA